LVTGNQQRYASAELVDVLGAALDGAGGGALGVCARRHRLRAAGASADGRRGCAAGAAVDARRARDRLHGAPDAGGARQRGARLAARAGAGGPGGGRRAAARAPRLTVRGRRPAAARSKPARRQSQPTVDQVKI
jgi:hypothetical protein